MSLAPAALFNLALIASTILTAALASWSMYYRARGSYPFTLLMLALAWWSCAYAQELSSTDLQSALLWARLQYLGIVATPPLWLTFGLRYSGHDPAPHPWNHLALAIIPLITLLLTWSSGAHDLIWVTTELRSVGSFRMLVVEHGPWFWVHTIYSYNLVIGGTALLLGAAWRAAPYYRRQAAALVVGALIPLLGNVVYVAGMSPVEGLDLTPLLLTCSGLLFSYATYSSHMTTIGPVARNRVIEEMADVVVVLDLQGRIADLNPAGRQLLEGEEAIGRPLASLSTPLAQCLAAAPEAQELDVGAGDAPTQTYDVQRKPLTSWRGAPLGTLIVLRDITRRRRAESRLRAQKELFAALAALAHAAAARPTMGETLHNVLAAVSELTGAGQGSIFIFGEDAGVVQHALYHGGGEPDTNREVIEQVLSAGLAGWAVRSRRIAVVADTAADPRWLQRPDAFSHPGSALAVPIIEGSHTLGVITLSHPAAHYFQAEQIELMSAAAVQIALAVRNAQMYETQRRLVAQAEAASRAKSTFLATVSHELRTPLNVIIGYGDVIAEELGGRPGGARAPGAIADDLRRITAAGRQLLGLVNDILELSRVEAGQSSLEPGPVDIAALAFNVAAIVRPLAVENQNSLELDCPEELGVVVTDLDKLRQVLLQLLANACKFTERGRVTLRVRREAAEPGEAIVFQVSDTGIGIADEQLAQLFTDFTQGDGSSTRRYGGVGVGLALSQQLCRLLGAEISVQSRVGHGSCFVVRLPAHSEERSVAG